MYPIIRDGDIVKIEFYTNGSSIDKGDTIVYHSWMVGVYLNGLWIGQSRRETQTRGHLGFPNSRG
ncbi:MAG: hypothetical protein JSW72_08190 [Candidatus Bathyarchaeota archaeon]|nr:MAG: hypothetical protein JSW72_08190 [Candidatus Bathyarchaeota archaeon]